MSDSLDPTLRYRAQHKRRLSYMPWLYFRLKPDHRRWAQPWQAEIHAELVAVETIALGPDCFIAPEARLFAERGRPIRIGARSFVAADCVLHGPIQTEEGVSINHHCTLDGGRAGIQIGAGTRIAAYCYLYAFNHGMAADRPVAEQPVTSKGISLGRDVWLGAHTGVVDGVRIGDGAVVGMGSVVTHDLPAYAIAAGNPARVFGDRRDKT